MDARVCSDTQDGWSLPYFSPLFFLARAEASAALGLQTRRLLCYRPPESSGAARGLGTAVGNRRTLRGVHWSIPSSWIITLFGAWRISSRDVTEVWCGSTHGANDFGKRPM